MNSKKLKIGIIGAGNVAYHMLHAFHQNDINVSVLHSRNIKDAKSITAGLDTKVIDNIEDLPDSVDVYLVCISDDHIKSVTFNLPNAIRKNCLVAHTSGSKPLDTLMYCKRMGVFYPLQTFSKGKKMKYENIPFCIHSNTETDKETLYQLASTLSKNVSYIDDEQRRKLHLSAVWINNFVNHVIYKAESILDQSGISADLIQPLLIETIRKQSEIGSKNAQTGPAKRNDQATIHTQLEQLTEHVDKDIYRALTQSIINTYK